ncbi:MAG: hypothetical protein ACRCV6_04295 [Formosimonas sp.]
MNSFNRIFDVLFDSCKGFFSGSTVLGVPCIVFIIFRTGLLALIIGAPNPKLNATAAANTAQVHQAMLQPVSERAFFVFAGQRSVFFQRQLIYIFSGEAV